MLKLLRILIGVMFAGLILFAATRAVRDCPAGPYVYDNCLWLWLRDALRLPQSKLLRAAALEFVGLMLLAGLWVAAQLVFPMGRARPEPGSDRRQEAPTHSRSKS